MIANVLQIGGAVAISLGFGLMWLPLGFVSAGIFAVVFGLALERINAE